MMPDDQEILAVEDVQLLASLVRQKLPIGRFQLLSSGTNTLLLRAGEPIASSVLDEVKSFLAARAEILDVVDCHYLDDAEKKSLLPAARVLFNSK